MTRDEARQAVLGQLATHADIRSWHTSPQQYADAVLELADRLRRQADNTPPPPPARPASPAHVKAVLAQAAAVVAAKKQSRETVNPNGEQA